MQKSLALLLCAMLFITALVGCGSNGEQTPATAAKNSPAAPAAPEALAPASEKEFSLLGTWVWIVLAKTIEGKETMVLGGIEISLSGIMTPVQYTFTEDECVVLIDYRTTAEALVRRLAETVKASPDAAELQEKILNDTGLPLEELEKADPMIILGHSPEESESSEYTFENGVIQTGKKTYTTEAVSANEIRVLSVKNTDGEDVFPASAFPITWIRQ